MIQTLRQLLVSYLEPRDTALDKDGVLLNCFAESNPEGPMIIKRPGNEFLASFGTTGEGAYYFGGKSCFIVDGVLYTNMKFVTMEASLKAGAI